MKANFHPRAARSLTHIFILHYWSNGLTSCQPYYDPNQITRSLFLNTPLFNSHKLLKPI